MPNIKKNSVRCCDVNSGHCSARRKKGKLHFSWPKSDHSRLVTFGKDKYQKKDKNQDCDFIPRNDFPKFEEVVATNRFTCIPLKWYAKCFFSSGAHEVLHAHKPRRSTKTSHLHFQIWRHNIPFEWTPVEFFWTLKWYKLIDIVFPFQKLSHMAPFGNMTSNHPDTPSQFYCLVLFTRQTTSTRSSNVNIHKKSICALTLLYHQHAYPEHGVQKTRHPTTYILVQSQ